MIRPDCLPLPPAMQGRPVERRGFPVPWFARQTDDGWDLRYADPTKRERAIRHELCWVSGQPLGKHRAFILAPESAIRRTLMEPPMKRDVALWAIKVCPFLTRPLAARQTHEAENSGVHAVWVTRSYVVLPGLRFGLGAPDELLWFARGEPADPEAVQATLDEALARLLAEADPETAHEMRGLRAYLKEAA